MLWASVSKTSRGKHRFNNVSSSGFLASFRGGQAKGPRLIHCVSLFGSSDELVPRPIGDEEICYSRSPPGDLTPTFAFSFFGGAAESPFLTCSTRRSLGK